MNTESLDGQLAQCTLNYLAAVSAQEHILLIRGHLKRKEGDTFTMGLRRYTVEKNQHG